MDNLEHVKDFNDMTMCDTVFYKTDSGHQKALFISFGKKDIRRLGHGAIKEMYHLPELKNDWVWVIDEPQIMKSEFLRKSPKDVFVETH